MKISEFIDITKFSTKRIIDFDRNTVEHFIQENKEADLSVLDEDSYNDLIRFLKARLKLTHRFTKKSESVAEEVNTVYICSGKELGEMLEYYRTLTEDQQTQTINHFKK